MYLLKNKIFVNIICIVCFFSVFSQMPFLVENTLTRVVSIPLWIFLFIFSIFKFTKKPIRIKYKGLMIPFVIILTLILFLLFSCMFTSIYIKSGLVYQIYLSVFIFLIGFISGRYLNDVDLKKISGAYFVASLIVCINIFFNYIYGYSINDRMYLYASKNSISQILLTGFIIILLIKFNFSKVIKILSAFFILMVLFYLKSRATLISVPFVFLYFIINSKISKKFKIMLGCLIIGVLFFLINSTFSNIFIYDIAFAGRDALYLDDISSGRIYQWQNFFYELDDNWLFGIGDIYRESFILTSILTFGFPIGLLLIFLSFYPIIWGYKFLNKKTEIYSVFILIAIAYFINSIFEGYAPFGPGTKCFFLWFLFGLLSTSSINSNIKFKEKK